MKYLLALFLVLIWQPLASAQTPITYKVWCTLHSGGEREYTVPNCIVGSVDLPIELPDYGRVICHVQQNEGREKTTDSGGFPANIDINLSCLQPLGPPNGSTPILIMSAAFAPAYNKRITVLDTPSCAISIELIKG